VKHRKIPKVEKESSWLRDKFAVSWQIVPKILDEKLQDKEIRKSHGGIA
jgi:predicted 3-demethylubiquinone-9 3-methyltransferase (glyoxalase superfamily)